MSTRQTATPTEIRWIGAIAAAAGLYFMLVGSGLLPVPGGPGARKLRKGLPGKQG